MENVLDNVLNKDMIILLYTGLKGSNGLNEGPI